VLWRVIYVIAVYVNFWYWHVHGSHSVCLPKPGVTSGYCCFFSLSIMSEKQKQVQFLLYFGLEFRYIKVKLWSTKWFSKIAKQNCNPWFRYKNIYMNRFVTLTVLYHHVAWMMKQNAYMCYSCNLWPFADWMCQLIL
jgi:hypothetical protein